MNLLKHASITRALKNLSSANGSTGLAIDMAGFEGCLFILVGSSLMEGSSNIHLKVAGGATTSAFVTYSTAGGVTCLAESTMTTGVWANKILALDLYKPLKRYNRVVVADNSSDVKFSHSIIALQYGSRKPGSTTVLNNSSYVGNAVVAVSASSY